MQIYYNGYLQKYKQEFVEFAHILPSPCDGFGQLDSAAGSWLHCTLSPSNPSAADWLHASPPSSDCTLEASSKILPEHPDLQTAGTELATLQEEENERETWMKPIHCWENIRWGRNGKMHQETTTEKWNGVIIGAFGTEGVDTTDL